MLHPSYSDLMAVANSEVEDGEQPVVQSRYSIVMATSKRARQIIAGDAPLIDDADDKKPLSIAVEELYKSKIKILENKGGFCRMTYRMIHFTKVSCFVGDKMKILFISLGCDKNLVDSEHMIVLL